MKTLMVNIWNDDYGAITLPDDFPATALTHSGWFDKRYKVYSDARRYIAEQSKKLEVGIENSGFRAPSFSDWRSAPYFTHAEFLANAVPKPFYGLGGAWVKPRVRVKMGRAVA